MSEHSAGPVDVERADLDLIERDLRNVETTLARLADGTYWTGHPDAPDEPVAGD